VRNEREINGWTIENNDSLSLTLSSLFLHRASLAGVMAAIQLFLGVSSSKQAL
jgi:hypothetical protein